MNTFIVLWWLENGHELTIPMAIFKLPREVILYARQTSRLREEYVMQYEFYHLKGYT